MATAPTANGAKYRTPRVPIQTPMFDANGMLTRTWVIFFERLGRYSTKDAVKDVVDEVAEDYEEATFVIYDPTVGTNVSNLLPVRRAGTLVDCEITTKLAVAADFTMDIFITPAGAPFASRASIFGTSKLTTPAGAAAGAVYNQPVFASDPYDVAENDVLSCDITASGGTGVFTAVLKWEV